MYKQPAHSTSQIKAYNTVARETTGKQGAKAIKTKTNQDHKHSSSIRMYSNRTAADPFGCVGD